MEVFKNRKLPTVSWWAVTPEFACSHHEFFACSHHDKIEWYDTDNKEIEACKTEWKYHLECFGFQRESLEFLKCQKWINSCNKIMEEKLGIQKQNFKKGSEKVCTPAVLREFFKFFCQFNFNCQTEQVRLGWDTKLQQCQHGQATNPRYAAGAHLDG